MIGFRWLTIQTKVAIGMVLSSLTVRVVVKLFHRVDLRGPGAMKVVMFVALAVVGMTPELNGAQSYQLRRVYTMCNLTSEEIKDLFSGNIF